jgi:hypothetical protein
MPSAVYYLPWLTPSAVADPGPVLADPLKSSTSWQLQDLRPLLVERPLERAAGT